MALPLGALVALCAFAPPPALASVAVAELLPAKPLFRQVAAPIAALDQMEALRAREVRVDRRVLRSALEAEHSLELALFDGKRIVADRERLVRNRTGSISWVGTVRGDAAGRVVLVTREGVTVGSIRTGSELYMLHHGGRDAAGRARQALYQVDEDAPAYRELPPTPVRPEPSPRAAAARANGPGDDGSRHDLLVLYTPNAVAAAGGAVAVENLVDLGVTETNLSYEASGVHHRLRLVHVTATDFDETQATVDFRDHLQDPDDGQMDEAHALRDQYAADLVKLIVSGGGCGRAYIMDEVSPDFEAFAFCWTRTVCISPGYTFQHELGHLMGGRHQWGADDTDNAPFTYNHGFFDPVNGFRTIMGVNDPPNCDDCPRRLAWANPDLNDPITGTPMGIPEGQPMASDNRKTLNATALTIANFRVGQGPLLSDDFETGDLTRWSAVVQ